MLSRIPNFNETGVSYHIGHGGSRADHLLWIHKFEKIMEGRCLYESNVGKSHGGAYQGKRTFSSLSSMNASGTRRVRLFLMVLTPGERVADSLCVEEDEVREAPSSFSNEALRSLSFFCLSPSDSSSSSLIVKISVSSISLPAKARASNPVEVCRISVVSEPISVGALFWGIVGG